MNEDSEREESLRGGIIILSGGHDVSGNFILTVPTSKLTDLSEWNVKDLTTLFIHLAAISKYLISSKEKPLAAPQTLPLACLADLRHASTITIKQLVEGLESVEHQHRGTISAVYFLKPRNKTKSQILKKLLGVKPSKKRPRVPLFKVVLMKTFQELHTHIDVSQLTVDFCGTLQYNHVSWMHLYAAVIKCIDSCQHLLTKLPSVRDKVDLLQEYETDGQSSSQVQQLLADLMEKFNHILSESCLPLCLTQCKQALFLLDHPSSDSHLSSVHPDLVKGLKLHLRNLYSELDQWNNDLEEAWRVTESRLMVLIQVHRHRERAKEIERKICEHYHPLLREHPIVGKTLSQAELYRAHFTTTLCDPAKELLSQATEILEAVQRLKLSAVSPPSVTGSGYDSAIGSSNSGISDLDVSDIIKCLTTSIQPFTTQLQHLQQLYVNIHIFHLLFEKALTWYKKVLKFLPESLLQQCTMDPDVASLSSYNLSPQSRERLVYMPTEWLGAVRVFLSRHPPPRQEHIDRLDESIPHQVDRRLKSQARSLALRLRLIQRILNSTRLPLKLVTSVLAWKSELFGAPQQEKSTSGHHLASPTKDRHKTGPGSTHGKTDVEQKEGMDAMKRDIPRQFRNKKTTSFDQEAHTGGRHGNLRTGNSKSGPATSEEMKGPQKPSSRRNSAAKVMSRSKSVEFSFNSSSTDGSVFDYEKALRQAEPGASSVKGKAVPRRGRSLVREDESFANRGGDVMSMWNEEQAFSDPSEMLQHGNKAHEQKTRSGHQFGRQRSWREDREDDSKYFQQQGHNSGFGKIPFESDTMLEPEPPMRTSTLKRSQSKQSLSDQQWQLHGERPDKSFPSDSDAVSPQPGERFVRLTFTPKHTSTKPVFKFGSMENLLTKSDQDKDANSESETGDGEDPYDNVVQRIREISASNLTNMQKLKCVSELISNSAIKRDDSRNRLLEEESRLGKLSFSTLDLRPREQWQQHDGASTMSRDGTKDLSSYAQSTNQADERPVDAVLRMKRNLARSMEDLNTITPYSEKLSQPAQSSCWTNIHTSAANPKTHQDVRYVSELKIQPVYMKPSEATKKITILKSDSRDRRSSEDRISSDVEISRPKSDEGRKPRSWSDVESVSPGVSLSSPRQEFASSKTPIQVKLPDKKTNTSDIKSSEVFSSNNPSQTVKNDPVPLTHSYEYQERDVSPRPSSLSLFSSRNFINPSFLRPASSMRDLRTSGHPEMTFDLPQDMDLEADYQALEDLEMLRTLQDDPFSNAFSKALSSSDIQLLQETSKENIVDKVRDEPANSDSLHSSENASQPLPQAQSSAQNLQLLAGSNTYDVPDITVGYLLQDEPNLNSDEEGEGDDASYLYAHSSNFDRLTTEADQEYLSQEEVADSLRKTQKILEEEENRRRQRMRRGSDMNMEENRGGEYGRGRGLNHTASIDLGYGSWTSKLMSTQSTSSEGTVMDVDRDWMELSASSADSVPTTIRAGVDTRSGSVKKREESLNEEDKPLTDPDLF